MSTANDICQKARLAVGDAGHTKWSDYECLTALQSALDMLVISCDAYFSPALVKSAELELEDDTAALPDDFRSVVSVRDGGNTLMESNYEGELSDLQFRFENKNIVSPESPVTLVYRYRPARLTALSDEVDVPETFDLPLARMTASILGGGFDAAQAISDKAAQTSKLQRWEDVATRKLWGGYNPYV